PSVTSGADHYVHRLSVLVWRRRSRNQIREKIDAEDMMSVQVASQIRYSHTIGRLVQTGPGFNSPVDVATAPGGRLYAVNRSNLGQAPRNYLRVTICTADEEYIGQFTRFGRGDGEITWPTSIAVDRDGYVYVSDEERHDVQVFDRDGNFLRRWGSLGSGPGQLDRKSVVQGKGGGSG